MSDSYSKWSNIAVIGLCVFGLGSFVGYDDAAKSEDVCYAPQARKSVSDYIINPIKNFGNGLREAGEEVSREIIKPHDGHGRQAAVMIAALTIGYFIGYDIKYLLSVHECRPTPDDGLEKAMERLHICASGTHYSSVLGRCVDDHP